ncbi:MAG TPA: hypothetical protein VMV44_06360 [Rectinemataceae bacterium]|nr:hypothetical protein [Rectinemataceae bacterium]
MRPLPPALRRFHARSWIAELERRSLLWLCLSTTALSLWTAACIVLSLPRAYQLAAVMIAASLLPAFLFWPTGRSLFMFPLREVDADSVVESWLEAGDEARRILDLRLADLQPRLSTAKRDWKARTKGLLRPALSALAALVLLQLLSMALLARPVVLWQGPETHADSGLRLPGPETAAKKEELAAGDRSPSPMPKPENGGTAQEAVGAAPMREGGSPRRLPEQVEQQLQGSSKLPSDTEERTLAQDEGTERQQSATSQEKGISGRPEEGKATTPPASESGKGGITGFEGSGAGGVPSPLVDYRTRLLKLFAASSSQDMRASGDLVTTSFAELQRRWFASFRLETGIGPREDPWTSLLRRRWAELLAGQGGTK